MAYREFTDEEGRRWSAWETVPTATAGLPEAMSAGWLCFQTDTEKRRLAPIPPDWETAPEEELPRFLHAAEEIRPTGRTIDLVIIPDVEPPPVP